MEAIKTDVTVIYNQKDITESIVDKYLISITYNDKVEGESDELSLTFEDVDGLWESFWYPRQGDSISAKIGDLDCGEFEIDDISYSINPSTITLKGLATGFFDKKLRTKRSFAHEDKTLSQIINFYAQKNGLTPLLKIRKDVIIKRETQNNTTDLSFLKSLSDKYGYVFSIRGTRLVFWDIFDLEGADPIIDINKGDLKSGNFRDKVSEIYSDAVLKYHNPDSGELVSVTVRSQVVTGSADSLELRIKAENKGQAEEIAKSELYKKNTEKVTGGFSLQGNETLVSGVNFNMLGAGNFRGVYHVKESTHKFDKSAGYTTDIQIKLVKGA